MEIKSKFGGDFNYLVVTGIFKGHILCCHIYRGHPYFILLEVPQLIVHVAGLRLRTLTTEPLIPGCSPYPLVPQLPTCSHSAIQFYRHMFNISSSPHMVLGSVVEIHP